MAGIARYQLLTAFVLVLWQTGETLPNVQLDISGSHGQHDAIAAGAQMFLDCKHNTKEGDLDNVQWSYVTPTVRQIATYTPDPDGGCDIEAGYAGRVQCVPNEQGNGHILILTYAEYPDDQGGYECNVTVTGEDVRNSGEESASVYVELELSDTDLTPPDDPLAASVELECTAGSSKPKGVITWSPQPGQGEETPGEDCDDNDQEYCSVSSTLTLTNPSFGHQVNCTITQGDPFDDVSHQHTYEFAFPAVVLSMAGDAAVEEGGSMVLTCTHPYGGDDFNQTEWKRGNKVVATYVDAICELDDEYVDREDDDEVDCDEIEEGGGHTFTIGSVVEEDAGTYQCVIWLNDMEEDFLESNTVPITVTAGGDSGNAVYHKMWLTGCLFCLLLSWV